MTSDALPDAVSDALQPSDSLWARWRTTPWRDVLRGRLSGSLDYRRAMVGHDLPQPLLQTVDEVVRRTQLWPREKCDVAAELCAHFADGLQAGHTAEELQKSFGSTRESATLIRRAKLRCRPWLWHIRHRTWQAMAVLALALAAIWSVLLIRFVTAKPTITFDLVADYDKESRAIPEEDRAWPLYREGLVRLSQEELRGYKFPVLGALKTGPSDPHWPEARQYLIEHEDAVEWFLRATSKPELGFINRDPENAGWLAAREYGGWETYNGPDTHGYFIVLAQAQDMRFVLQFLYGACHAAAEDGDGPRLVTLFTALLRIPDHARQAFDGFMADLVAFSFLRGTSDLITSEVLEHPELFTDANLQQLAQQLHRVLGGRPFEFRWTGERRLVEDYIQHAFSDDGNGNGRFTPAGFQELKEVTVGYVVSDKFPVLAWIPNIPESGMADSLQQTLFNLSGAAVLPMVADRRTVRAKWLELDQLRQQAFSNIHGQAAVDSYEDAIQEIMDSPSLRRRFLPVAVMLGGVWYHEEIRLLGRQLSATNLRHDAAIVAIALEQYRRRTGEWPDDLALLTPDLLAEVPRDLYAVDDAPLTYRVVDGRPLLYSVGPNRQDDGGTTAGDGKSFWEAEDGDWVLLPPREPAR